MNTDKVNTSSDETKNQITFGEKIKYRLAHPRFIASENELRSENHRYDPAEKPTE